MATQAHTDNGTWSGSAGALAGEMGINPRTARAILEKLEEKGYLRRWPVPGKHLCYPIRIHKYQATTGEHADELVDAVSSTGPRDYRWFDLEDSEQLGEESVEHGVKHDGEDNASQKRIKNLEIRTESYKDHAGMAGPCMDDSRKGSKLERKTVNERKKSPHWDWFAELFRLCFAVLPTDGKKQRKLYEQCCRRDGEKLVLLALVEFAARNQQNSFEDISAAGFVFLTSAYEDHEVDEQSDWTKDSRWPDHKAAPLFAKWFGTPAAKEKQPRRGRNR